MGQHPTHHTPSAALRHTGGVRLQPMFDTPVPRPSAGRNSKRTDARPWEPTTESTQPAISRHDRRRIQRHFAKHHAG